MGQSKLLAAPCLPVSRNDELNLFSQLSWSTLWETILKLDSAI